MRSPEASPHTNWLRMHRSHSQGIVYSGVRLHRPYVFGQTTISSLGSYTTDEGISEITTASSLQTIAGNTIWLGTTMDDGTVVWKVRTRARATATSTTVKVAAFGQYDYHNLDAIKSINEFLPHIKRPRYKDATNEWLFDWEDAYTNEGAQPSPQAQMGTAFVYSEANSSSTRTFDGTRSKAWASGATITGYSWNNGITTETGATPSWTTNWRTIDAADETNSKQHIKLTVTDSNGKTHTTRRLFFGITNTLNYDDAVHSMPGGEDIICTEITSEFGGGARAKFVVRDTAAIAEVLDGNEIVVFGIPRHDAEDFFTQTYNNGGIIPPSNATLSATYDADTGRGDLPILFDGYIVGESLKQVDGVGDMTFEAVTADVLLESQYQVPYSFALEASPADLFEVPAMTVKTLAWYLIRYFSTLADVRDVDICQLVSVAQNDTQAVFFDFQGGGFISQLRSLLDTTHTTLSFDTQGTCYIERDLQLNNDAEDITYALPLEAGSCHGEFSYERNLVQPTAQVYLGGGDTTDTFEERIPQGTLGYGTSLTEVKTGIVGTQAQITALAKRKYQRDARRNSAGLARISVELGNMPFDVVPQTPIALKTTFGGGGIAENPFGLIRSPFIQSVPPPYSPPVSPQGMRYFLEVEFNQGFKARTTFYKAPPLFITYHATQYHTNIYNYADEFVGYYAAIGKLCRTDAITLIGGNLAGAAGEMFIGVEPQVYSTGNNEWDMIVYAGSVGIGTTDSAAYIANYIINNDPRIGAIATVRNSLTYLNSDNHGDYGDIITTGAWEPSPPLSTYYEDYVIWASVDPNFAEGNSTYVHTPVAPPQASITTIPRALTWSLNPEVGDMRCRYDLEPIAFTANDETGYP